MDAPAWGTPQPSSQQPLWAALQAALSSGNAQHVLQALQTLSQARHLLGTISETDAAVLYEVLVFTATNDRAAGSVTLVQAVILALAISLLARWSLQLQRTQSPTSGSKLLNEACGWVLQHPNLLCGQLPHTTAAVVLFLSTAYPRCPSAQSDILACCCSFLSQSPCKGQLSHQPWPQGNPLVCIAACQDVCMGCELLLQHLITVPPVPGRTHPVHQLMAALLQGVTHVITDLMSCTTAHQPPTLHLLWHLPATHLVTTALGSSSGQLPHHPSAAAHLTICSQISMRIMATVAASLERWSAWWAQAISVLPAAESATQANVLRDVAAQVHATCSQGMLSAFTPHPGTGSSITRSTCSATAHMPHTYLSHAGAASTFTAVMITSSRTSHVLLPGGHMGSQSAQDVAACQGASQLCVGLLLAAGLLQGLATSLRTAAAQKRHPSQLAALRSTMQPAVNALGASVQACLAAVCKQAADELGQQASHHVHVAQAPSGLNQQQQGAGAQCVGSLLRWTAGYVQGHLVDGLSNALVAVPGPLAVHLPAMVVDSLLGCVLSCEPLLILTAQQQPAQVAAAWLQEASADVMHMRVASLARFFIQAVQSAQPAVPTPAAAVDSSDQAAAGQYMLDSVLTCLQRQAALTSRVYAAVVSSAPEGWLSAVSGAGGGLRDLLDKLYVVACTPLPSLYTAWPQPTRSQASCRILEVLSALHFCAVQLPLIGELMQQLVPQLLSSTKACTQLLASLPCYDALLQPAQQLQQLPAHSQLVPSQGCVGSSDQAGAAPPRWLADPIMGASLLVLLPIASAAACKVDDSQAAVHQLLPVIFLLLKHPQAPLTAAAHSAMVTLVARLCELGQVNLAASALPYYVQRSLQQPWHVGQLEALEAALPRLLSSLPVGCTTTLYCLKYVTSCAVQWFEQHPAAATMDFSGLYQRQGQAGSAPGASSSTEEHVTPEAKFFSIMAGLLLVCDWAVLPTVTSLVTDVVEAAGQVKSPTGVKQQQVAMLQYVYDMLLRSDDYVRKRQLMDWFQGLVSSGQGTTRLQARVWSAAGLRGQTVLPGRGSAADCDVALT